MSPRLEGVAWATLSVLLCTALYEALVAVGVIPLGHEPGDAPAGETFVLVCALLAFLLATGACLRRALAQAGSRALVWLALAPAGFLFTLARWYGYDPYYLPTLRRYNTNTVHGPWMAGLGIAALVAAALGYRWPRAGAAASAFVLLVAALTSWWLPIGK